MSLFSSRTLDTLIDLVEIKLSCLDVTDRDDRAEYKLLQRALTELETARRAERSGQRGTVAQQLHH